PVFQEFLSVFDAEPEFFFTSAPLGGDDVGDWKTLLRVLDRRSQEANHRQLSVTPVKLVPTGHSARRGHRMHTGEGHLAQIPFPEKLYGGLRASPAATVQSHGLER